MQPTLPQQTVLDTIFQDLNQNFVVQGVPGAGKTTLISMVANRFLELGVTDILALTFSRSLAEDMGKKVTNGVTKTAHLRLHPCSGARSRGARPHQLTRNFVR